MSKENEIIIAKFMQLEYYLLRTALHPEQYPYYEPKGHGGYKPLEYHSDWNMLMPVVQKIRSLEKDWPMTTDPILSLGISSPIELVYKEVVRFINKYNLSYHP